MAYCDPVAESSIDSFEYETICCSILPDSQRTPSSVACICSQPFVRSNDSIACGGGTEQTSKVKCLRVEQVGGFIFKADIPAIGEFPTGHNDQNQLRQLRRIVVHAMPYPCSFPPAVCKDCCQVRLVCSSSGLDVSPSIGTADQYCMPEQ
jgi:hypothetical protein